MEGLPPLIFFGENSRDSELFNAARLGAPALLISEALSSFGSSWILGNIGEVALVLVFLNEVAIEVCCMGVRDADLIAVGVVVVADVDASLEIVSFLEVEVEFDVLEGGDDDDKLRFNCSLCFGLMR